jgi:hypothetical protein
MPRDIHAMIFGRFEQIGWLIQSHHRIKSKYKGIEAA